MDQNIYKLVYKVTHAGGSGSCFYLKSYNLFVTNYHVVNGFHTVAIHDNDRNPYLAKVVLVNPSLDIALLAVDADFSVLPEQSPESISVKFPVRLFLRSHPLDTDSSVLPELPAKAATLFHAPGS